MRKIELICARCKNPFIRLHKEYIRFAKKGRTKFFCTFKCSMLGRRDEYSDFRPTYSECKKTAKFRKKEFNLTLEYLKSLWETQRGVCPYTGILMSLSKLHGIKHTPNSSSLDRIDSSKGYIEGNVEFVCLFINYGKNGFSKEQTIDFLRLIKTRV